MTDTPVVPGRVYGLRRWRVDWDEHPPALNGWGAGGRWSDGEEPTKARCVGNRVPRHRAPYAGCSCGLYGLHPRMSGARDLRREVAGDGNVVVGIVEAWGQVELHRDGFRAEYARPHALVLFQSVVDPAHEARTRAVAKAHGVPVLRVAGAGTLYRHCVGQGLGMDEGTVNEVLLPAAPERFDPKVGRRRTPIGETIAEAIGGLAFIVLWLLLAVAAVTAIGSVAAMAFGLIDGDDAPPVTVGDNRYLRVIEQEVVPLDDGGLLYVGVIENQHPRRTALGVFPRGTFRDADDADAGSPDSRFGVDQRPTIPPGQTGVVIDYVEERTVDADTVEGFDLEFRARGFAIMMRRPAVRAGRVRLDRRRCLLTTAITSIRPMRALDVPVVGRDRRGRIDGAAVFEAGPVPRGRSQQVLDRVDPELCGARDLRLEAYPNARPGQLRP